MSLGDPDGAELLAVARRSLFDDVLPLVPEERRYGVLMIASAMAIAGREIEERGGREAGVAGRLSSTPRGADGAMAALCRDIRAGGTGPFADEATLRAFLHDWVVHRLALANPKFLAAEEKTR